MAGRFVALGDSFTEGVGDWEPRLPNGVRGWADRVAKQLSRQDPDWEYANLAIRSKRLHQIIEDQLEPAIAMKPTLVSLYAGGNDILEFRKDLDGLMDQYEALVARLAETGAQLLLFTGYDVQLHPMLEPMKRRNWRYNEAVRRIARKYDALLVDFWCFDAYHDPRMWDADRLHMSKAGHKYMAAQVLRVLGVDHKIKLKPFEPWDTKRTVRQWAAMEREWMREWVLPMFGRRIRGITLGDTLSPRWPVPIKPADGLKTLARERLLDAAEAREP